MSYSMEAELDGLRKEKETLLNSCNHYINKCHKLEQENLELLRLLADIWKRYELIKKPLTEDQ